MPNLVYIIVDMRHQAPVRKDILGVYATLRSAKSAAEELAVKYGHANAVWTQGSCYRMYAGHKRMGRSGLLLEVVEETIEP